MIDVQELPRAILSVEGIDYDAPMDLFVLSTNDFSSSSSSRVGIIIPLELNINNADGDVLVTNESFPVTVRAMYDVTVTGTATGYEVVNLGAGEIGTALGHPADLAASYTIDVACWTQVTAAGGESVLASGGFNSQIGYAKEWIDHRPVMPLPDDGDGEGSAFVVRLDGTPTVSHEINASLTVAYLTGVDLNIIII